MWSPVRFWLTFVYGFRINNRQVIPKKQHGKGLIIVSNHVSIKDPFIVTTAIPLFSGRHPIFYISMPQKFYERFGKIVHALMHNKLQQLIGGFSVVFGQKNYEATLKKHVDILNAGGTLLVFVEGKISRDGTMHSPKPGVGYLVERTDADVLPVAISGAYKTSAFGYLRDAEKRVQVTMLDAFKKEELLEGLSSDPLARLYEIAEKITARIENFMSA
ncbi:MAG: lysophospholipid acyltransferase family protein [bacterium]|nr:lysophospholipid acyltransferase family protein [bacterium]